MGIALNRPDLLEGTLPLMDIGSRPSANVLTEEIPPREVVRCQQCRLVQYRTATDHCRRCAKPLPSLIPFGAKDTGNEAPESTVECDGGDGELPTDRAGRNRRVSIGAKMKELREERQFTQIEMSSLLGIPRSYLSRIENSRLLPGPMMVAKFATALEVEISELLPLERRKDGIRLFPNDPALAALYTRIARLPVTELEKVLAMVRGMVQCNANLRPIAVGPVRLLQQPEAVPASAPAAQPARATLQPGTRRLAIVAAKGSSARR